MIEPLYTGQVNGRAIRFFRAPNGVLAFPWHACADLVSAAALPEDAQEVFLSMTASGQFQDDVRTIQTSAGAVLIAPHFVAQGAIRAFQRLGLVRQDFEDAYCMALTGACDVLHEGMTPEERFQNLISMGRYHLGREDDV
ncbi:hypothetical protein [Acetobacter estunensis]|uniref:hypothetical protein n=1 Tax=Acetobacter estunensis TaxID=104097 RepID=UPI001C2D79A9|nr:hypothetical protein [Acetobacter estunensis]MBV1837173.1 hypothetical protein [Acetobacter estunensis]